MCKISTHQYSGKIFNWELWNASEWGIFFSINLDTFKLFGLLGLLWWFRQLLTRWWCGRERSVSVTIFHCFHQFKRSEMPQNEIFYSVSGGKASPWLKKILNFRGLKCSKEKFFWSLSQKTLQYFQVWVCGILESIQHIFQKEAFFQHIHQY